MYAQVDKAKENGSKSAANSVTQKKNYLKQGFGYRDNRRDAVVQMTNRTMPTREQFGRGVAAYKANPINRGKDYPKTYEEYIELFNRNENLFDKKIADQDNIKPSQGDTVYHTTDTANLAAIRTYGLSPKHIDWGGPDSSKDGVLSFAKIKSGTGAMSGRSLHLRVMLRSEHVGEGKDWWSIGLTELRTTQTFARADIMKYDQQNKSWVAL